MKITELRGYNIQFEHGRATGMSENGVQSHDVWRLTLVDKQTGDVTFLVFDQEVRDGLLAQLTKGVVLAPGDMKFQ